MNMFKKNGGFTLVELIVVIAILAILAGVAVPAYSGYITKAQDAAIVTELDAIAAAAQAANATAGEIEKIEITVNGTAATITVTAGTNGFADKYDSDFVNYYSDAEDASNDSTGVFTIVWDLSGTSYENGATWYPTNGWNAN